MDMNYYGWDKKLISIARQYDRDTVNFGLHYEKNKNEKLITDKNELLKIVLIRLSKDPLYYEKISNNEDQIDEDVSSDIKREYDELMKMSISKIKDIFSRSHRVSDTQGVSKSSLVTDILRAKYGDKKVNDAFGLKENSNGSWLTELYEMLKD